MSRFILKILFWFKIYKVSTLLLKYEVYLLVYDYPKLVYTVEMADWKLVSCCPSWAMYMGFLFKPI